MHKLLKRQLERHLSNGESHSTDLQNFISEIDATYQSYDLERDTLESSLDIETKELYETNLELCAVFHALPDLVLRLELNGEILDCNAGSEINIGVPKQELIGKSIHESPEIIPQQLFSDAISELLQTKSQVCFEYKLQRDVEEVSYEARMMPLPRDLVIVVIRNVTEKKHAESINRRLEQKLRQSQKMEAVGTLAGGIAHDFNNLLGGILGYDELAIEGIDPDSPIRKYLDRIRTAGLRARDLVAQILDYSRQSSIELSVVPILDIVEEALEDISSLVPENVELEMHTDVDCGSVLADPSEVHRIVANLCKNAIQAMEIDGGTLSVDIDTITVHPEYKGERFTLLARDYIRLSIRDTGCGMNRNTLERIYEPFFTTKKVGKGTGLGLSTVHNSINNLGGSLSVHSSPGVGTTFFVYFPATNSEIENAVALQSTPRGDANILIVDDEEMLTTMCSAMLSNLGYSVTSFTDSKKALEYVESGEITFDLIVTDQRMPQLSGSELAAEVHRSNPTMPIVLVTGFSEDVNSATAKQLGFADFIPKPYSTKVLGDSLAKLLSTTDSSTVSSTGS